MTGFNVNLRPVEPTPTPYGRPEPTLTVDAFWHDWCIAVAKMIKVYCGISVGILFVLTWLLLTGHIIDGPIGLGDDELMTLLKPLTHTHTHTIQFYAIVITILASIRGGLFYMGVALSKAAKEKDSGAIGIWIIIALVLVLGETLLGVALLQCLPGVLLIILVFITVEIVVQATFIWVVWSFKRDLDFTVLPHNDHR